nr:DUF2938 family protein [Acinetobacter soli]
MEVVYIFWIGVAATICMDLSSAALKFWFGVQSLDYSLVGRWLLSMPKGYFVIVISLTQLDLPMKNGWAGSHII